MKTMKYVELPTSHNKAFVFVCLLVYALFHSTGVKGKYVLEMIY